MFILQSYLKNVFILIIVISIIINSINSINNNTID